MVGITVSGISTRSACQPRAYAPPITVMTAAAVTDALLLVFRNSPAQMPASAMTAPISGALAKPHTKPVKHPRSMPPF